MDKSAPSMLKATMIGGLAFGAAAAIPVVNLLNCACCALVVGGGFVAAFLYSKECQGAGAAFRPGNGALVGLVAGLFYAIGTTVVGAVFRLLRPVRPEDLDRIFEMLEQFDLPPEAADTAAEFLERSGGFLGMVFGFFFSLLVAAVFSTIGGLIGGAVFKVEPPPPPPPPAAAGPPEIPQS